MIRKILFSLCFLLMPLLAHAQQGGGVAFIPPITPGDCAKWYAANILQDSGGACGGGGGSGTVTSISNSDGTVTLTPNPITTTGTVSLNLGNANTWTAVQSFTDGDLSLLGSGSGNSIIKASATGGGTATLPSGSGTLVYAAGAVTSIAGTANQITASASTGAVTLSIPSAFQIPGTINKITLTQPATGATLTIADGKTFTDSNTLTLTGTDGSSVAFGAGGTVSYAVGANPTATAGPAAVNGSSANFMRADGAPAIQKGLSSQFGIVECDNVTITCPGGVLTASGGSATAITVGTTTIVSGTNTRVEFNNSGVLGEYAISGTGSVAMTASPTFTGAPAIAAATGTSLNVTSFVIDYSGTAIPTGGAADTGYLFSSTAHYGTFFGTGAPTVGAAEGSLYLRNDTGHPYYNTNGTTGWADLATGGTVTSVATNAGLTGGTITTTGTIGLAAIAADNLLANSTGSSAAPIATSIGSCSAGSSALTYNTSTHAFGCNSISGASGANPSATIGLAAVNGAASTFLRSDGAPALSQAIAPTWTAQHIWNVASTVASASGAALDDLKVQAATTTLTGTTTVTKLGKVSIYQPTITDASGVTVTDAASLYVDNVPLAAGSVTITNPWAILVGTGASKLQATTLNGALTYGGVTLSNSVTGTGSMVLATSPTLVTPVLGVASGTSVTLTGAAPQVVLGANTATLGAVKMFGNTSGDLTINPAAVAGTASKITFPAGTTDFSSTGGTSQVVKQTSSGGALTVGQLACSDLSSACVTLSGTGQALTGGFHVTANNIGTVSSGTTTIDCGSSPLQYLTDNGAFTLAAPANDSDCSVLVTNGASAGAITFSGFTVGASTGDALDTTNTHKFMLTILRINSVATYLVKALQ